MIDVADSSAVYYYHYNALGSVVALSDSYGDSCQSYEYSAFGEVWASDPNFIANPYMFTGRRFDYETGLYYYRARYYNPYIGRFLQTDPVGYGDGINWYAYCGNNPLNFVDPSGLYSVEVKIPLEVIWHQSSVGASIGGTIVQEGVNPQHKKDVLKFLAESNFYEDFSGVTLEYVIYSGDETSGSYLCGFEVPDTYDSMRMDTEPQAGGVEVLVVTTGHWYSGTTSSVKIWDWRLLGMLGENLARAQVDDASRYWADAWIHGGVAVISGGVLLKAPVTWPVSAPIFAIFSGWTAYDMYKLGTSPETFPNYIYTENYLEYIERAGGYDNVISRYEDYKRKRRQGLI